MKPLLNKLFNMILNNKKEKNENYKFLIDYINRNCSSLILVIKYDIWNEYIKEVNYKIRKIRKERIKAEAFIDDELKRIYKEKLLEFYDNELKQYHKKTYLNDLNHTYKKRG